MMIRILLVLGLLLHPLAVLATDHPLADDRSITFNLPSERWEVSTEPPESAIRAMMADMAYETEKKGVEVDRTALREKAVTYARTNNLFVHDPKTSAYLMISISRTKEPPKDETVRASADWALNEIVENAGEKETRGFGSRLKKVQLPGLQVAYQIEADYPLRGAPHNFIGIIGFADPYWVFLYYNDQAQDPEDLREMRLLLASVSLARR